MSRASWLAVLCALHAHALGSPRTDPTVGRAVFTGATLPNATSIDLNPAALGLGTWNELYFALMGTLDQYEIDPKHLDLDSGALSDGDHVSSTLLSPGGMAAVIWHPTQQVTLALNLRSSPGEKFISGEDELKYHTLGGEHRMWSAAVAGSFKVSPQFLIGISVAAQPSFLWLRYARDTALEAERDPERGIDSDCGGSPCGIENPAATETYSVYAQSNLISTSNFALNLGLVGEPWKNVWIGLAYHAPPGLAPESEVDGTVVVDRAMRDGGGRVDGAASVYFSQPASFDLAVRVRLPAQWELHVASRLEFLSRFQRYDVRPYGSLFDEANVPEWMPRPRGLRNNVAAWAGIEQIEQDTFEPMPWRVGVRAGFESESVDADQTSPTTVAPLSFTADFGAQLRFAINDLPFVVQLTLGAQYFPPVNVTDSAFDPRARLACADSGHDYSTNACRSVREGYALPTAAGDYQRFQLASRFAVRYEF